jgi:TolA-binding protein
MKQTARIYRQPLSSRRVAVRLIVSPLRVVIFLCWTLSIVWSLGLGASASAMQAASPESSATNSDTAPTNESVATRAARLLAQPRPAGDIPHANLLVQTARTAGRDGDLETALRLLSAALDHYLADSSADHHQAIFTVRTGIVSAAWQLKDYALVVAQSEAILKMPAVGDDSNARIGVMQMLAKSLSLLGRHGESLAVTRRLAGASDVARSLAAEHSLVIGAAALRGGQPQVAAEAYQLYLEQMPGGSRIADAELGIAWAAVSGGQSPEQADQLLSGFISSHPEHRDVPHAIVARAGVLDRLGQSDTATQLRLAILADYADSVAATQVLDDLILATPAPWPASVRSRWQGRLDAITGKSPKISAAIYESLLAGSVASSDDPLWRSAVAALVKSDSDGKLTGEVLDRLAAPAGSDRDEAAGSRLHVAEHLAIDLLGRLIDSATATGAAKDADTAQSVPAQSVPAACESACRWAGASGRWTMLAMVATDLAVPDSRDESTMRRGVAIDRMVAESLMQTQRAGEALPWWLAIVDAWQCDDFPTLIRAAETAVAFGSIDVAVARLEAAKAAAADDEFKVSLTRMLEAELAIRRARLDEARDLLAVIVRATETTAELRPRAQWLIGETYFLQQKYAEAIDAYRRVDTLDATGQWAALALLQAGKSFEKLARPREAATCYTALLTRFADLPHANHARTRLAQISGEPVLRR